MLRICSALVQKACSIAHISLNLKLPGYKADEHASNRLYLLGSVQPRTLLFPFIGTWCMPPGGLTCSTANCGHRDPLQEQRLGSTGGMLSCTASQFCVECIAMVQAHLLR
jgi:hypothetical protein